MSHYKTAADNDYYHYLIMSAKSIFNEFLSLHYRPLQPDNARHYNAKDNPCNAWARIRLSASTATLRRNPEAQP